MVSSLLLHRVRSKLRHPGALTRSGGFSKSKEQQKVQVQLKVKKRVAASVYIPPSKPGDVVWAQNEVVARHLLENDICEVLPGMPQAAPPGKGVCRRSSGWPMDRFAVVDTVWRGSTVVCIAGGPSLTEQALRRVQESGAKVIAVNDSYLVAPFADVNYFADARWWGWHFNGVAKSWPWVRFSAEEQRKAFAEFAGQKVSIGDTGLSIGDPEVYVVRNGGGTGLSLSPTEIRTGGNSGYQAVNLAVLAGARKVVLVAYDMKFGPGGRSHSHNGHAPIGSSPEQTYLNHANNFKSMLPDLKRAAVDVVNCSPGSALACFRRGDLVEELAS